MRKWWQSSNGPGKATIIRNTLLISRQLYGRDSPAPRLLDGHNEASNGVPTMTTFALRRMEEGENHRPSRPSRQSITACSRVLKSRLQRQIPPHMLRVI